MKKSIFRILNRYSLIYLPFGWIVGLAIIFITFEPFAVLYFLSFVVIGAFFGLYLFTSNRGLVIDDHNFSASRFTIIEFYSDYWLGCSASKFIVNEFKKKKPDIPVVSVNASKKNYNDTVAKYNLEYTPTYVLVDRNAELVYKRVGNFKLEKFESLTTWLSYFISNRSFVFW